MLPLFRDAIFLFFVEDCFLFLLCLFSSSFHLNICHEWVAVSARGRAFGYIRNSSCFMSERSEGKTPTDTHFSAYLNRVSNTKEKIIIWTPTDQGPTHAFYIYPHPHLHRERRSHPPLLPELPHFLKFREPNFSIQRPC